MAFAELSGGQTPMEAARGAARGSRAGPAAAALGALAGRAGARWGPAAAGAALLWARLADAEAGAAGATAGGAEGELLGALLQREDGGTALVLEACRRAAGAAAAAPAPQDLPGETGSELARRLARRWRSAAAWRSAQKRLGRGAVGLKPRVGAPRALRASVRVGAGPKVDIDLRGRRDEPPRAAAGWGPVAPAERERARAEAVRYFTQWPVPVLAEAARARPGPRRAPAPPGGLGAAGLMGRLAAERGPKSWESLPPGVRIGLLEAALLATLDIPVLLAAMHAPAELRGVQGASDGSEAPEVAVRLLLAEGPAGLRGLHPALLAEVSRHNLKVRAAYAAHLRRAKGSPGGGEGWEGGEKRRRIVHLTWREDAAPESGG